MSFNRKGAATGSVGRAESSTYAPESNFSPRVEVAMSRSPITGRPRKTPPAMRVSTLTAMACDAFEEMLENKSDALQAAAKPSPLSGGGAVGAGMRGWQALKDRAPNLKNAGEEPKSEGKLW